MTTTPISDTPEKCYASRCRQSDPTRYAVTTGAWLSVTCPKHLGVLVERKLTASTDATVTVTPWPRPATTN